MSNVSHQKSVQILVKEPTIIDARVTLKFDHLLVRLFCKEKLLQYVPWKDQTIDWLQMCENGYNELQ